MLRAERRKLGLTQAQLAARAGIGRQKLIEVEQGKPGVAFATYVAAMSALGVEFSVKPRLVRVDCSSMTPDESAFLDRLVDTMAIE
ncbi:helix-turn-helix domain-containing protein [Pinirhizobacter sp.]|uniref:helix-turn-helix domain-containing protein n=1 Tax=Pinirhizobacter sp. TaxID=2950432 RepID=UPI0039C915A4